MTWDVARLWTSLDATYAHVKWVFKISSYPEGRPDQKVETHITGERIDRDFIPDGSPSSTEKVKKHLVWMFEETRKVAAEGNIGKAQRWLGFIQGATWALGLASVASVRAANRKDMVSRDFKVGDTVQCLGEGSYLFEVAKVHSGHEEGTGSAFLTRDGELHGWEDFKKLRAAPVTHG